MHKVPPRGLWRVTAAQAGLAIQASQAERKRVPSDLTVLWKEV